MSGLRFLAIATVVLILADGATAIATDEKPDVAKLIVGKWQVTTANDELPPGSLFEFAADGKLTVTRKQGDNAETLEATYKIEGGKLMVTLKVGAKEEKKDPVAIDKISDEELVLRAGDKPLAMKRVK